MKRIFFVLAGAALLLAACNKNIDPVPSEPDFVKIEPVITRALSLNFNAGDKIGLDIVLADGTAHAQNALLTYSEGAFSGDLKWYADGGVASTLFAYYPYQAAGFPAKFSVEADQTGGTEASDLMVSSKTNVLPNSAAILMPFKHQFAQVVVNIDNQANAVVSGVTIKGLIPDATVSKADDGTITVLVDAEGEATDIKAEELTENQKYCAIVVPQSFDNIGIVLDVAGTTMVTGVESAELKAGYSYTVNVKVSADSVTASIDGEIEDWEDGGELGEKPYEPAFEEFDGYFVYDGVTYHTAEMADGNVWMTDNLRYVPVGYTPCNDLSNVKAGVYYPVVLNSDHTAAEFSTSEDVIAANGYLYQCELALGLKVGGLKTVADAEALEGAQGICPKGWHIPTADDIMNLVGKAVAPWGTPNTSAPYYDTNKGGGSIEKLNADGFNASAWGAVSVTDNTKTSATLTGYLKTYPDVVASGFVCGSSYAGVSYNTSGDETSGIKNIQFLGFMPMMNNGTFNGSKVSYRMAATVRCLKDKE